MAASADPAITLDHVTKIYRRYGQRRLSTLKSALISGDLIKHLRSGESFKALDDVSVTVKAGQSFGVIGRNGSGKSTTLKLVAGITKPTAGTVSVRGRISALIELGAGFHPEISGRENVFINGMMLGLTKREIQRRFDAIVEFAELADFIDAPVKTYSSGMYMRLGFAVAIHVDPDVLLVDEVLAVGDEAFTHKCLDTFADFKRRNKTILLVTHSLSLVERFCDQALWLDAGRTKADGDPKRVVGAYVTDVERQEEQFLAAEDAKAAMEPRVFRPGESAGSEDPALQAPTSDPALQGPTSDSALQAAPRHPGEAAADMTLAAEGRWGSGGVEIHDVRFLTADGQRTHVFHTGEAVTIRFRVRARTPVRDFVFGLGIYTADGTSVYGTNTEFEELQSESLTGDGEVAIVIDTLDLVEGTYKVDLAVHKKDGAPYDYHRLLYTFRMKSRIKDVGIYRPAHRWEFSPEVRIRPRT